MIPAYVAAQAGLPYSLASTLFLTFTTVGFHGTRQDWLFQLDLLAILNFNVAAIYNISKVGPAAVLVWFVAVSYSILSYFGGQKYSVLSFDPNWNIQMFFHSFIHFSTCYVAYIVLLSELYSFTASRPSPSEGRVLHWLGRGQ